MSEDSLHATHHPRWLRYVQLTQWFSVVAFFLAIVLAALSDFMSHREGVATVVVLGLLGLLAMISTRLILKRYR